MGCYGKKLSQAFWNNLCFQSDITNWTPPKRKCPSQLSQKTHGVTGKKWNSQSAAMG